MSRPEPLSLITNTLSDEEIRLLANYAEIPLPDILSDKERRSFGHRLLQIKTLDLYPRRSHRASFRDWSFISVLSKLEELDLCFLSITQLPSLEALTQLKRLKLVHTSLTDISPLSPLRSLEWLNLTNVKFTDLTPLESLPNLNSLNLSGSNVSDLSPLSTLPVLSDLNICHTGVVDLKPLMGISQLQILSVDGNDRQNIDILTHQNFPALRELWILYDDYYPMLPGEQQKWNQLKQQLPNCSLSRITLY